MNNKFINCSKCGTRNFNDDIVCGVCGAELQKADNILDPVAKTKETQKINYWVLVLIFGAIFYLYYNVFNNEKAHDDEQRSFTNYQTKPLRYSVIEKELNNKRAFNVTVRIEEKLTDDQIKEIANKVKSDIKAVSKRGVVFFILPEMVVNNIAWAAVDFDTEPRVRIIGMSIEDEQKIMSSVEKITDYVGLWIDNGSQGDVIIRIRNDKRVGYVFEYISSTDHSHSELATPLIKTKNGGKIIYKDTEHAEQFFLVENNGDLSAYDNQGIVATYKKLR